MTTLPFTLKKSALLGVAVACVLPLAACGGGGGSDGAPSSSGHGSAAVSQNGAGANGANGANVGSTGSSGRSGQISGVSGPVSQAGGTASGHGAAAGVGGVVDTGAAHGTGTANGNGRGAALPGLAGQQGRLPGAQGAGGDSDADFFLILTLDKLPKASNGNVYELTNWIRLSQGLEPTDEASGDQPHASVFNEPLRTESPLYQRISQACRYVAKSGPGYAQCTSGTFTGTGERIFATKLSEPTVNVPGQCAVSISAAGDVSLRFGEKNFRSFRINYRIAANHYGDDGNLTDLLAFGFSDYQAWFRKDLEEYARNPDAFKDDADQDVVEDPQGLEDDDEPLPSFYQQYMLMSFTKLLSGEMNFSVMNDDPSFDEKYYVNCSIKF